MALYPSTLGQATTLVASDLDNTYITPKASWAQAALADHNRVMAESPNTLLMGNTARGLTSAQSLAAQMHGTPLKALAVNKGESLFLNPTGHPADEWAPRLSQADRDPCWERELKTTTQWDHTQVIQQMRDLLAEQGFQKTDPTPLQTPDMRGFELYQKRLFGFIPIHILWFPDEPAFNLFRLTAPPLPSVGGIPAPPRKTMTPAHAYYGRYLAWTLQRKLSALGMQTDRKVEVIAKNGDQESFVGVSPKNIQKDDVIAHLVQKHMPAVQRVVTAGDSPGTDIPMLDRPDYGRNRWGELVENHPVLSGIKPGLTIPLSDNRDVQVSAQEGQIALPLSTHLSGRCQYVA